MFQADHLVSQISLKTLRNKIHVKKRDYDSTKTEKYSDENDTLHSNFSNEQFGSNLDSYSRFFPYECSVSMRITVNINLNLMYKTLDNSGRIHMNRV